MLKQNSAKNDAVVGKPGKGKKRQAAWKSKCHQVGVISIEMMVAAAIIIALLLGVGGRVAVAWVANDNTQELSNISALYTAIKDTKTTAGYGANGTDLSAAVIAGGKLPGNITVTGNTIQNGWGGTYAILSTVQGFTVASPTMPIKNCIKVAAGASASGQYAQTSINGGTAITGPLTTPQAVTGCSSATNTILFTSVN